MYRQTDFLGAQGTHGSIDPVPETALPPQPSPQRSDWQIDFRGGGGGGGGRQYEWTIWSWKTPRKLSKSIWTLLDLLTFVIASDDDNTTKQRLEEDEIAGWHAGYRSCTNLKKKASSFHFYSKLFLFSKCDAFPSSFCLFVCSHQCKCTFIFQPVHPSLRCLVVRVKGRWAFSNTWSPSRASLRSSGLCLATAEKNTTIMSMVLQGHMQTN